MGRVIVHLDADAFFASVEQAADPRLRGKPVAVGGEKRGIIASASYEARRMGIYTPMPGSLARKLCPNLIILPGDFEKYEQFSRWMFSYAQDFTPDVEIASIDEGYFDLTAIRRPAIDIAATIRQAIQQSLKISVSEGIASNKLVSQVASKFKKPGAFIHIPSGMEKRFLEPLPSRWLPGVGEKTEPRLKSAGLAFIGQVAATPVEMLRLIFGGQASMMREFANGIDERPVIPVSAPAKSYSKQKTFEKDVTDEEYIEAVVRSMADRLMEGIRADKKAIRTITLRLRYNDMEEDSRSESLNEPTNLETDVYSRLSLMLKKVWRRRVSVRMVSVKFSNVYDAVFYTEFPMENGFEQGETHRKIANAIDTLRKVYGNGAIMRGHDLRLLKPPSEIANLVGRMEEENNEVYQTRIFIPRSLSKAGYIPLNVASYYSFLDSTVSTDAIVSIAQKYELKAAALTDSGNLHGAVEFFQKAKKAGIKPIIGVEIRIDGHHTWLYVENGRGYSNLCKLLSRSNSSLEFPDLNLSNIGNKAVEYDAEYDRDVYHKRNFTMSELEQFSEGLIIVGGHKGLSRFNGQSYQAISREELRKGETDNKNGVAVFPIRYGARGDWWKYDVVQSIRTRTLLGQRHPEKLAAGEYHFPSPQEVREWFKSAPLLVEKGFEIADRCNFEFEVGKLHLPKFTPPDGLTTKEFLRRLVMEGLRKRYRENADSVRHQIEEELGIIGEVGYEDYFLVVWDLLQECKRRGIDWLTRGSAADSLVCYCLGISGVCPIRFNLYFRRFLNKERMAFNKLPDIDIDFPHNRKDDVVKMIFEKYGREYVAVVGGFSTFQARSAVGDAGKVFGLSERQVRQITTNFPWGGSCGLVGTIAKISECKDLPINEEPYKSAIEIAELLDGFPRYPKMHPCGVVLSPEPIHSITPTFISAKGYPATHYDMDSLEALGLIKMDILAQGGLAVMRDATMSISRTGGKVDLDSLEPWNDQSVWKMIADGEARAVHHIESPVMIGLCKMMNIGEIDGLVALVSVIRPGAANEQKKLKFTRCYQGYEKPYYPHPLLEPILKETFGVVVYEEHILQICDIFAGLSPGRADTVRRALGKGKTQMIAEIETEFFDSARKRGHSEKEIEEVWGLIKGFAGYAFCKAHSAAYAVEAYQSAWLKKYYPVHFMAAVLSNGKGFYDPLVYILECHRLGIKLLPPAINQPGPDFEVCDLKEDGNYCVESVNDFEEKRLAIRIPAVRTKGISERTIRRVLSERSCGEFKSIRDFVLRVSPEPSEMEALIRVGAFDGFGKRRTEQFWEFQQLYASSSINGGSQRWLFEPPESKICELPKLEEPTFKQKLLWEYELLGFTASAHPLALYDDIAWRTYCPVKELKKYPGEVVACCGLVIEQRLHHQITGEPMKFLSLADWTGIVETELFAPEYKSYGLATVRYPVLEITAKVEPFENRRGFSLMVIRAGKPRNKSDVKIKK